MLRPKPDIFQRPAEVQAFLDGYGISTFDKDIYKYFVTLYEFF